MNIIRNWNNVCLQLVADDHTGNPPPGNQGGPTRTSRALAMIHLAMHDVVAVATGAFPPYITTLGPAPVPPISVETAVSAAARLVAGALFPSHAGTIERAFEDAMIVFPPPPLPPPAVDPSITFGEMVGQAILNDRINDQSEFSETGYKYGVQPGEHRPDPHSPGQTVLGPRWGNVRPFTYPTAGTVPLAVHPALGTAAYATAYNDVIQNGRDDLPRLHPNRAMKGIFWGYDGSQKLGTPPRLYNQIVRKISADRKNTREDDARLFALVNVGMADAGISAWFYKYKYNLWRPVVAIREASPGSGTDVSRRRKRRHRGRSVLVPARRAGHERHEGQKLHSRVPGLPIRALDFRHCLFSPDRDVLRETSRSNYV